MTIANASPPVESPASPVARPAFGRFRPALRVCRDYFWILPALIAVLAVRAIRPLVLVRFGRLTCHRIGHYIMDPELYLCQRDAHPPGRRQFDIFYNGRQISNEQVKTMWRRTIRVWDFAGVVDRVNRLLPGGSDHILPLDTWVTHSQDMYSLVSLTDSHLSFTAEEEARGRQALRDMGVADGGEHIVFHARDASYLESALKMDSTPYNYRDADIDRFVPAMNELGRRGYSALRMGSIVEKPLTETGPKIIDYATNHRSAFLDIYLFAKCRFFLGSHTGLFQICSAFRRPSALVNVVPVNEANTWQPGDMFITKKMWLLDEGRYMSFAEIFESGVAGFNTTGQYAAARIQPVENTAEDITALALEMDSRLAGDWETTPEDEVQQWAFWSVFRAQHDHGKIVSRIGRDFLRNNPELLA